MGDLGWSVKKGDLGGNFTGSVQPRLSDRIGAVAAENQFVFFAERHDELSSLKILSDPATMRGLSQGGHKAIATEIFSVGYNKLFESYYKGEISEQAMRFAVTNMPTNLSGDMNIKDSKAHLNLYADIAAEAKRNNIRFYGVGAQEGNSNTAEVSAMAEREYLAGQGLVEAMKIADGTPGFYAASRDEQSRLLKDGMTKAGVAENLRNGIMGVLGYGETRDFSITGDMDADELREYFSNRLDQDHLVAKRIEGISQELGGGVTTVYGGLHLWRGGESQDKGYGIIGKDIDDTLGNHRTAVISIFEDSKEFWNDFLPKTQDTRRALGIQMENGGDYQLDVKNGKWFDGRTGQNSRVELPDSLKPPAADPALQVISPRSALDGLKW